MKKKLKTQYNLDKLKIYYDAPGWLPYNSEIVHIRMVDTTPAGYENKYGLLGVCPKLPMMEQFIFTEEQAWAGKYKLKNPVRTLICILNGKVIVIGKVMNHLIDGIVLEVDNKLLYSNQLELIYDFELVYNLTFNSFKEIDICCDSNTDLPRKLVTKLQSKQTVVTRPGRKKKYMTKKGNLKLCNKIVPVIKVLTERERMKPTFYFDYRPSGSNSKMELIGYDKTEEIEEKSKKYYILEALKAEGRICRLEIAFKASHITSFLKNMSLSQTDLYLNINDHSLLKLIFILNLNRFFTLKVDGRFITISKILCLD